MKLYGIANCSTVKKARAWLEEHRVAVDFQDFKKNGVDAAQIDSWIAQIGWEALINRKGTTWRQLTEEQRLSTRDAASAKQLMLQKPSVIRRPLVERDGKIVHIGFDDDTYQAMFGK